MDKVDETEPTVCHINLNDYAKGHGPSDHNGNPIHCSGCDPKIPVSTPYGPYRPLNQYNESHVNPLLLANWYAYIKAFPDTTLSFDAYLANKERADRMEASNAMAETAESSRRAKQSADAKKEQLKFRKAAKAELIRVKAQALDLIRISEIRQREDCLQIAIRSRPGDSCPALIARAKAFQKFIETGE